MNYHSMVERNREASRQMAEMAVQVIRGMVQRGEKVKVTELVRRTGFSRAFFYRNGYSALTGNEREQLCREDKYLPEIGVFPVLGTVVEVFDMDLTEALQRLPALKRNVILMVFFLDMTEQETAEVLHKVQSTVHYHKKHSLKLPKKFLEEVDEKTGLSDPL